MAPTAPRPRPAGGPGALPLLCGGPRGLHFPGQRPLRPACGRGDVQRGGASRPALRHSARRFSPDELATLFQHAAAFRYDARQCAADARLGEGVMSVHACACAPQGVLCRTCLLAPAHPWGTHDRFLPSRSPFEPRQSDPPSLQQGAQDVMKKM